MGTHSIIVIKNDDNKYLQYFDERWNSYLFLNCKLPNGDDANIVKNKISDALNMKKDAINVSFIGSKRHEKFSESDKVLKEYVHHFYRADLGKKLNDNEFEINGVKYKWFSYSDLMKDGRIKKVNSDIVRFVKEFNM